MAVYGPPNTPTPTPTPPVSPPSGGSSSTSGGANIGGVSTPVGTVYGVKNVPLSGGATASAGVNPRNGGTVGGSVRIPFKKTPKKMAKGGSTASKRADGLASKGKTRGKMI